MSNFKSILKLETFQGINFVVFWKTIKKYGRPL